MFRRSKYSLVAMNHRRNPGMGAVLGVLHAGSLRVLPGLGMRFSPRFFISAVPIFVSPGPNGGNPLGKRNLEPF